MNGHIVPNITTVLQYQVTQKDITIHICTPSILGPIGCIPAFGHNVHQIYSNIP